MTSISRVSLLFLLLLMVAFTVGCPESSTTVEDPGLSETDLIKSNLQMIVDNGQMGSEMMSIQNDLIKLKDAGDPQAEALIEDLKGLEGLSGPPLVTAAQAMIDKLNASAAE